MKIRRSGITPSTLLLLAVSFFGLPSLHGAEAQPELRIRQYTRQTKTDNDCVKPNPYQYLQWIRGNYNYEDSLFYDPWDNGSSYYTLSGDDCSNGLTNNNAAETQLTWPCCANQGDNGYGQGWQWNNDHYSEWAFEIGPFHSYYPWIPWEHRISTNTVVGTNDPSGLVVTNISTYYGDTRIDLLTGGQPGAVNHALFVMSVGATNCDGSVVEQTNLTALGKTPHPVRYWNPLPPPYTGGFTTTEWLIFKKLDENQTVDATVLAPGDCYSFGAAVGVHRLVMRDGDGNPITDQTQTVFVGERVYVHCAFFPPLATNVEANIEYSWTVPGVRIDGWERVGSSYAAVIPHTNDTEQLNGWFWVKDQPNAVVQCSVTVLGETFTAKTTFNVKKPEAWFRVWPKGPHGVEVTTHASPNPALYYLTTGHGFTHDDAGVRYDYGIDDMGGFDGPYSFSFGQLAIVDEQCNEELPPVSTVKSWSVNDAGVDGDWPYHEWGDRPSTWSEASDTPRSRLYDYWRYYKRADNFISLLMWQSLRRDSIPVPLKRADWGWNGTAKKIQNTSPPVWFLYSTTRQPALTQGTDWHVHPQWTRQLWNPRTPITNDFYYPEPQ